MRPPFLVLDGVDGCGKSTQARRLVEALRAERSLAYPEVLHLREPGSTSLGEALRELVLSRAHRPSAEVEVLVFAAARRQMLDEVVAPALTRGAAVVCERFHASTFAYQACAAEVGEDRVLELLAAWANEPRPDLTLVLDLAPEVAAARRGAAEDRIEDKGLSFQRRVEAGYRRYVEREPRAVRVDADGDEGAVFARVWSEVLRVL